MSKWVRGIYNAAANFNMSNALRAASGRLLGGDNQHVREEHDKPDERIESSQSSESAINNSDSTTATPTTSTSCARATTSSCCTSGACACTSGSAPTDGLISRHIDINAYNAISESVERDYAEYTASISASGKDLSSWVRISHEPRSFKQANADETSGVEYRTGIPTGVTV